MSSSGMSGLLNGFMGTIFRTREYERWFVSFWGCRLPNGFMGTIFRTRDYGWVVFVLFLVCGLLNGFMGTIFRTREYERWFVLFWGCRLLNGFTGTIFRTRECGECLFSFLSLDCSQWLHGYDFSYPRVWGGCLFPFF